MSRVVLGHLKMASVDWQGRHWEKDALRQAIWSQLQTQGVARGNPFGHIPNFLGAETASARLTALEIWQMARVIKCNPDSPQQPVRSQALQAGKTLYMAVPQLSPPQCFVELTAAALPPACLDQATTPKGAMRYGRLVSFEEMQPIDLVVVGCVAVAANGGRTGKGAGFADLELAMLATVDLIQPETPIVTTVHGLQVAAPEQIPMQPHDWPLDVIVTPERVIETQTAYARPQGLDRQTVQADQLQHIPILRQLLADRIR
jgi:5-formyltetrahydrofolate cyclo-ligase